jgi:hypothetical protein
MNIPKSTAENLAAASQAKPKISRPKKTVPFAGQMSTFSTTDPDVLQSSSKTQHLNDPKPCFPVIPIESGFQFKPVTTPLSFFPEQEPEDEAETSFDISISDATRRIWLIET